MQRAPVFGGTLFALAASVMTDLIHHDPLCYSTLDSAGLPQAFLSAVTDGVIASSEAVCNVPNTLVALCLTSQGLERVREAKALSCFVPIMTTPTYQKSLQGETPSILGAGLDELLRHVPSLREEGVGVVLCIIRRLLELGGRSMPTSAVSANATETMDYMSEMERSKMPAAEGNADSMETDETTGSRGKQVDDFPIDSYLGDCVTHSVRMLESMLSNTETSRLFVDKGGVELLLGLYGLPKLPPSFASGTSTTNSLLPIFRLFAPIHAASLSQTVRCALDRQLMECLAVLEPVNGQCILDLPPHQQDNVIRLVSASEGLAAVAGTVVRASNVAALQEVASGIAPVLAKLCSMEQSIFQQLAALDLRREEKLSKEQMLLGASEAPTGSVTPSNAAEAVAGSSDALALEVDIDHNTPVVIGNPSASDTHLQNSDASQPTADKGRKKKSPEDSCYELLHHASITIRGLYGAVAKTIHTPVRRRDGSSTPSPTMVGAAAALGAVLKSHFKYLQERLPSENAVSAGEDGSVSTANDDRSSLRQGIRVVEETISLLFDARRHTCHHLVLNFFHRFGGMNLLLCQFDRTVAHMWKCQNENVDFQPPGTEFDNPDAAASVAPAKPNTDEDDNLVPDKDRKDLVRSPKQLAESAVLAFLGLLERLTNANLLLGGSSSSSLLTASFLQPAGSTSSTPASSASSHEGLQWIKRLQSAVVQHVLPVWNSSSLFQCSPRLVSSVITTLTNSMDGAVVAASHTATRPGGGRSHTAPDPDMIQQIVDMGFTHARAEEAFRQVGQNSIELAMEWLVSHAEEPAPGTAAMDGVSENAAGSAEEDVHQILIAAFGNDVPSLADPSDNMPKVQAEAECEVEDTIGSGHSQRAEFLLPPPQEFVDRAVLVLTSNESSSFPLADLLQTLCSKNDGKDCAAVVQHLIDALRAAAVQAALLNYESKVLLAPSLLLALLVSEDAAIRKVAAELKLVVVVLDVLQAWETARSSVALESVAGSSPQKWVDALLLVLDAMLQSYTKASVESEDVTQPAAKAQQQSDVKIMTPAAVEASNSAGACTSDSNPVNGLVYQVMQQWCPAGYLSEEEQDRALGLCLCLLRHLHSHVQQDKARGEIVPDTPDPADTCQATLQVLSHLTKRHQAALQVLNNGVPHLLLSLPQPCFKAQLEPYISAVFRHILEDPQTLQVRYFFAGLASTLHNMKLGFPLLAGRHGGRNTCNLCLSKPYAFRTHGWCGIHEQLITVAYFPFKYKPCCSTRSSSVLDGHRSYLHG